MSTSGIILKRIRRNNRRMASHGEQPAKGGLLSIFAYRPLPGERSKRA